MLVGWKDKKCVCDFSNMLGVSFRNKFTVVRVARESTVEKNLKQKNWTRRQSILNELRNSFFKYFFNTHAEEEEESFNLF